MIDDIAKYLRDHADAVRFTDPYESDPCNRGAEEIESLRNDLAGCLRSMNNQLKACEYYRSEIVKASGKALSHFQALNPASSAFSALEKQYLGTTLPRRKDNEKSQRRRGASVSSQCPED